MAKFIQMKKNFVLTFIIALTLSCNLSQTSNETNQETLQSSYEILFEVKTSDKADLEVFEDGIIPWISIQNPENSLENLIGKDEIIVESNKAILVIDYPLNNPVEIEISSEKQEGFTRKDLILIVSQEYKRIYNEEEESADTKTIAPGDREGLMNRNQTDGKYGIWGHDINDLDLSAVVVHTQNNSIPIVELYVES